MKISYYIFVAFFISIVKGDDPCQHIFAHGEKGPGLVLSIELIAIIVVGCVVFLLILVGIVDKLTCPQKSGDDIEDGDEDDSKA